MKKNRSIEVIMTAFLLVGALFIPRESMNTISQTGMGSKQVVVMIDPGHGGVDSGKVGIHGELEKDINLSISGYLKQNLEACGIKAILTREDDSGLYKDTDSNKKMADMKARIQKMTDEKADLVVSIHQNSYTKESVQGAQVFYYTGSKSGEVLAESIQKGFDLALGDRNTRGIKANKDYYILVNSPIPAVICECGFLSNAQEAEKLCTEEYQKDIAKSIETGIINYLKAQKKF